MIDPSSGRAYMEAPLSGADDVEAAVRSSQIAFQEWRLTTPGERSLALFRMADVLESNRDELIAAEVRNTGKPVHAMRDEEFPMIIDHLRYFAAAARGLRGLASGSFVAGHDSSVRREPVGVVVGVVPWNYPLLVAAWKFAPAIAAGNTIILKPSDTTPVTAVLAAEMISDLVPRGVLNVVVGDRDTGRALVAHPGPQLVSLTGSERAGIEVSGAAAAGLKRVSLELGGNAPVLVFEDVDIVEAARGIAVAAFGNAGQDCEAATRVLVSASIHDEFVSALVDTAHGLRYGLPEDTGIAYGALNSETHLHKVQGFVDRLPEHARVLTGGSPDRTNGGYFYPPTVVTGVHQHDEIVQEEVFGPLCTIQSFTSEQEAVQLANDVRFGLAASVWTNDHRRALRLCDQLDFGKVWVNCHLVVGPDMPNNGYKHSGHGNDLSAFAIEEYTRIKHVMSATGTSS
ncbi:betaine-aldehyde dehydrogenase [Marmoricola sp. URHA0025 HA25]